MKPNKSEVFDSRTVFPLMYHKCIEKAQELGYAFISFNGMVFKVTETVPEYKNRVCMYDEISELKMA